MNGSAAHFVQDHVDGVVQQLAERLTDVAVVVSVFGFDDLTVSAVVEIGEADRRVVATGVARQARDVDADGQVGLETAGVAGHVARDGDS